MINKLMEWLENGVELGMITGYAVAFKSEKPKEKSHIRSLKKYSVYVEHCEHGECEWHAVMDGAEIIIQHEGKHIETLVA